MGQPPSNLMGSPRTLKRRRQRKNFTYTPPRRYEDLSLFERQALDRFKETLILAKKLREGYPSFIAQVGQQWTPEQLKERRNAGLPTIEGARIGTTINVRARIPHRAGCAMFGAKWAPCDCGVGTNKPCHEPLP